MKKTVTITTLAAALALSACGGTTTNEAAGNYNDLAFDNLTNSYEELPIETSNGGFGNEGLGNDTLGNGAANGADGNVTVPAAGAGGAPTSNASAIGN